MIGRAEFEAWDPTEVLPRSEWPEDPAFATEWLGGLYHVVEGLGVTLYLGKRSKAQKLVIVDLFATEDLSEGEHWITRSSEPALMNARTLVPSLGLPNLFGMQAEACENALRSLFEERELKKFSTPAGYSFVFPGELTLDVRLMLLGGWKEPRVCGITIYHSALVERNCRDQDSKLALHMITSPDEFFEDFDLC